MIAYKYGMKERVTHNRKDAKMADFISEVSVEETTPHLWEDTLHTDCCYEELDNTPREGDMVICPCCKEWSEAMYL